MSVGSECNPQDAAGFTAWNPGILPGIPGEWRSLESIYRPEHVASSMDYLREMSRWSGLPAEELATFLPQRLALHELIIRITSDIAIPECDDKSIYGRNCRRIATEIFNKYIVPRQGEIEGLYAELGQRVDSLVREIVDQTLLRPPPASGRSPFRWFAPRQAAPAASRSPVDDQFEVVSGYKEAGLASSDPLRRAVYKSLYRVFGNVLATQGRLGSDRELLCTLVAQHVRNTWGSQVIGERVSRLLDEAIERDGYRRVGSQQLPILVSLKGASAAGKSSLRPMLIQVMRSKGINFDGYVTISPDVWRRMLLDYGSLGAAYKYAGYLTSRELAVIDAKLDRYLRDKAERAQQTPHLLVDRFRFDSFSSEKVERVFHDTYAKYIDTMYMVFIVTPPEETVVRGWKRGLQNGRYKAVEDFLGHCVEAYVGMPKLFYKWLASPRPEFRYTFLDNDVPKGIYPNTIAYGDRSAISILDPRAFINIERYQKINTRARSHAEVYPPGPNMAVAKNAEFLKGCLRRIRRVNFVEPATGKPYVCAQNGAFAILDREVFARLLADPEYDAIFAAIAPGLSSGLAPAPG